MLAINHLRHYITELEPTVQRQIVLIDTLQGSIEAPGSFVSAMHITRKGTPNFQGLAAASTGFAYTRWGDPAGIFLVIMEGKCRETLIDADLVWPNGLVADCSGNHHCWTDARLSESSWPLASRERSSRGRQPIRSACPS